MSTCGTETPALPGSAHEAVARLSRNDRAGEAPALLRWFFSSQGQVSGISASAEPPVWTEFLPGSCCPLPQARHQSCLVPRETTKELGH